MVCTLASLMLLSLMPAVAPPAAASATHVAPPAARPDADPHPCGTNVELSTHGLAETTDVTGMINELIDNFAAIDVAAHDNEPDKRFTKNDLKAVKDDDESYSDAAEYFAAGARNHLFDVIDTDGAGNDTVSTDGRVSKHDLEKFLQKRTDLAYVYDYWDELDLAAHPDKEADGRVSSNDFKAAKDDTSIPKKAREAFDRAEDLNIRTKKRSTLENSNESKYLLLYDVVRELVGRQTFVEDGDEANEFVRSLPLSHNGKSSGLKQGRFENDDVTALAKAALVPAEDDYTDVQTVIAHLPETDDAVRNKMITGFYCDMAKRADAIFSRSDSSIPPGAVWLDYAPWASFSIGKVIGADMRAVWGFDPPTTARQAAGDGNQWIFNDITSKFAAFIELYEEADGDPTSSQLDKFLSDKRFGEGALQIRSAFVLYAASKNETDPATRQRMMFQANALIAIHEQSGVDGYLDDVMVGPGGIEVYDWKASQYMDMTMGDYVLEVNKDLDDNEIGVHSSNLIDENAVLELDPGTLSMDTIEDELGVTLPSIKGWADKKKGRDPESMDIDVSSWQERKGEVSAGSTVDDSLEATGVGSWGDYGDRMWFLFRLFEQLHVDTSIPPTTVEKAETDATDADLVGVWNGQVAQVPAWPKPYTTRYDISIDPTTRELVGMSISPELGCGGDLEFLSSRRGEWQFIENITFADDNCIDDGTLTLKLRTDGAVEMSWDGDYEGRPYTASSLMRKVETADTLPLGTWSGDVSQSPAIDPYSATITLSGDVAAGTLAATVDYSNDCSGTGEFIASAGGVWAFRESITTGTCIDGGIMSFVPRTDGTIEWAWTGTRLNGYREFTATSTLRPR